MRICYLLVDTCICFTLLLGFFWILVEMYIFIFLLFCFKMWICCRVTARKQEVLLNFAGTPQWRPLGITLLKYLWRRWKVLLSSMSTFDQWFSNLHFPSQCLFFERAVDFMIFLYYNKNVGLSFFVKFSC